MFLKNAEIVCSVDKYPLPLHKTYNNSLNVIRDFKAGCIAFNASCNEQVFFLLNLEKNLKQIRIVIFEKNTKNAP